MLVNSRKRWASKEEARNFAFKAFHEGRTGLSFWAACDYIGWTPKKVRSFKLFFESLYGDFLSCEGKKGIEEEISALEWEINNIQYVESHHIKASIKEAEEYLKVAKDELRFYLRGDYK